MINHPLITFRRTESRERFKDRPVGRTEFCGCCEVVGQLISTRLPAETEGRVNCCWSSPPRSFLVPSPAGLMTIFYCPTTRGVVQLFSAERGVYDACLYNINRQGFSAVSHSIVQMFQPAEEELGFLENWIRHHSNRGRRNSIEKLCFLNSPGKNGGGGGARGSLVGWGREIESRWGVFFKFT
jgi:hypothetical protein